ncbi:hypothetical protein MTO96_026841 [Rhipicephalus appendiculatus]
MDSSSRQSEILEQLDKIRRELARKGTQVAETEAALCPEEELRQRRKQLGDRRRRISFARFARPPFTFAPD